MNIKAIFGPIFRGFKWFMENEQVEKEVKASKDGRELLVRLAPVLVVAIFQAIANRNAEPETIEE